MKLKEVLKIATPTPLKIWRADKEHWYICETQERGRHSHFAKIAVGNFWHNEGKANAILFVHCRDRFEGLVKALEKATTLIEDEYPDNSCEERQFTKELRELLNDVNEVEEI